MLCFFYSVQWRREDGKDIVIRNEGRDRQRNEFNYFSIIAIHLQTLFFNLSRFNPINQLVMKVIEGEKLSLSGVQRSDMGGYLCIASNGIPPSVSKRYDVQVNCKWPIKLDPKSKLRVLFF